MEYKIATANTASELASKVNDLIKDGWQIVGSHQVLIKHQQNRFRGEQHVDTINDLEYTQTLTRSLSRY
jgi:hypothetical protein